MYACTYKHRTADTQLTGQGHESSNTDKILDVKILQSVAMTSLLFYHLDTMNVAKSS